MRPVLPDFVAAIAAMMLTLAGAGCDDTGPAVAPAAPAAKCEIVATPAPGHYPGPITVTFSGPATTANMRVVVTHTLARPRPITSTIRTVSAPADIPQQLTDARLRLGEGYNVVALTSDCDDKWYELRWDVDSHEPQVRVFPDDGTYRAPVSITLSSSVAEDAIYWKLFRQGSSPVPFGPWEDTSVTVAEDGTWTLEAFAISPSGVRSDPVTATWTLRITAPALSAISANDTPGNAVGTMPQFRFLFDDPMETALSSIASALDVTGASGSRKVSLKVLWADAYTAFGWPNEVLDDGDRIWIDVGRFRGANGASAYATVSVPEFRVTSVTRSPDTIALRPAATALPTSSAAVPVSLEIDSGIFGSPIATVLQSTLQTVTASVSAAFAATSAGNWLWFMIDAAQVPAGTTARLDLFGELQIGSVVYPVQTIPPLTMLRLPATAPSGSTARVVTVATAPLPVWAIVADAPLAVTTLNGLAALTAETSGGAVTLPIASSWLAPGDGQTILIRPQTLPADALRATLTLPSGSVRDLAGNNLPVSGSWSIDIESSQATARTRVQYAIPPAERLSRRARTLVAAITPASRTAATTVVSIKNTSITLPILETTTYLPPWRANAHRSGTSLTALSLGTANVWPPDGFAAAVSMSIAGTSNTSNIEWQLAEDAPAPGGLDPFGTGVAVRRNDALAVAGTGAAFDGLDTWPATLSCQMVPPSLTCPDLSSAADGAYGGGSGLAEALLAGGGTLANDATGPAAFDVGSGTSRWLTREIWLPAVEDIPVPVAPPPGATAATPVTFSWSPGVTASVDAWALFVGVTSPTPTLMLELRLPVAVTSVSLPIADLLPPGSYVWTVAGVVNGFDPLSRSDARVPVGGFDVGYAAAATRTLEIP